VHISKPCQHLLFALFFSSEYGVKIEDLRVAYGGFHPHLCAKYGEPHDPKDFEEALRILEGGFISVIGKEVRFVNPSLRDYLTGYLDDPGLLQDFAAAARQGRWAQTVWQHGKKLKLSSDVLKAFALSFVRIAGEFVQLPIWERVDQYPPGYGLSPTSLSNTSRIELLLAWWEASQDERFADLALALARAPVGGLNSWLDGDQAIELLGKLRDGDYFDQLPCMAELADSLEDAIVEMIDGGMPSDELANILGSVELWRWVLGDRVAHALDEAIRAEIDQVSSIVSDIDSESTLKEHGTGAPLIALHPPVIMSRIVFQSIVSAVRFNSGVQKDLLAGTKKSGCFGVGRPV
jgi:hypothetical protein